MKKTLAAAVLTGGKSSRMGSDKAFLPLPNHPGDTFLSHIDFLQREFRQIQVCLIKYTTN